jgi:hypothetical protein
LIIKYSIILYVSDAPSAPAITSDPHSAEESSYTLTWTTESYYPITAYTITYRKTKVSVRLNVPITAYTITYRKTKVSVGTSMPYPPAMIAPCAIG